MRYLKETTVWDKCEYNVKNHTYIVQDGRGGKMLGYVKSGTSEKVMFAKPMFFDRRNRTFKELKKL